ncbi:MAG TPA: DEAD/DEAH box helicase [Clostridiales bacterium]|nr:DEAD/DEAH box helicase [Clostridiales bacterium]
MDKDDFENYNLNDEIKDALKDMGYISPTKVQKEVIPLALQRIDLIVRSNTGSGKTAAYGIPICHQIDWMINKAQVLVLTPTRELAIQVKEDFTNIGRYKRVKATALLGGQSFQGQQIELKQKTHIVVGTPGRVLDHIKKGTLSIDFINYLVIDEADEMLNMGFIDQVESIINKIKTDRVTMLFSATMPEQVRKLSLKYMFEPINIDVLEDVNNDITNNVQNNIEHIQYKTEEIDKLSLLLDLTVVENPDTCIIFCNTKEQVDKVYDCLKLEKYSCDKMHGGLEQRDRMLAIDKFKKGKFRYLIATNLVARGIDVEGVPLIINYDIFPDKEVYIHRTGRTARAGLSGKVISLITPYDERYLSFIEDYIGFKILNIEVPTKDEVLKSREAFDIKMKEKPTPKQSKAFKLNKQIMKLRINIGKKKGIRATTFVGIISNIEGVTAEDIGIITIMDTLSFIEILNGKGQIVLNAMKRTKIKDKAMAINVVF